MVVCLNKTYFELYTSYMIIQEWRGAEFNREECHYSKTISIPAVN